MTDYIAVYIVSWYACLPFTMLLAYAEWRRKETGPVLVTHHLFWQSMPYLFAGITTAMLYLSMK